MPDDVNPEADEYTGDVLYDATGARLGTIAAVDEDEGVLYLNPDPDPTEEAWAQVGGSEFVNYDNNWLGVPDYKVWDASDADTADADTEFDEWPYTVAVDEIDRIDDEGIYLESTSLTDLVEDLLPFVDPEE